jgi:hypothetical protein
LKRVVRNRIVTSVLIGLRNIIAYFSFLSDLYRFKRQAKKVDGRFSTLWKDRKACLRDKMRAITLNRHYVFHTAWAADAFGFKNPEEIYDNSWHKK